MWVGINMIKRDRECIARRQTLRGKRKLGRAGSFGERVMSDRKASLGRPRAGTEKSHWNLGNSFPGS